jgi:predicted ATPase
VISQLTIRDFKRFVSQAFDLKPLTIFAGRNGAGKTSAIHGILLARHATARRDGIAELNGPFGIELGWFDEVVNQAAVENTFSIVVRDSTGAAEWAFAEGDTELYATVALPKNPGFLGNSFPRSFQYLSAERVGPRITQQSSPLPLEMLEVGVQGEFTAQVIERLGNHLVEAPRLCIAAPDAPPLIKAQSEQWLSRIARPVEMDTSTFPGTGVTALTFRAPGGTFVRPTNMGFGVSYALPVVLAALTAPKGGVLIVENPEAHLHPAGQSEMGVFLATMAAAGVQVILETHSDHVLNGIRKAIGHLKLLNVEDAIVHFFSDAQEPVESLHFTGTGGVTGWPQGFFDQYQLDIALITSARRSR